MAFRFAVFIVYKESPALSPILKKHLIPNAVILPKHWVIVLWIGCWHDYPSNIESAALQ